MRLRHWVLIGCLLGLAIGTVFAIGYGRTGPGGLWLDGTPDPAARQVSLFVFGSCSGSERIRSVSVDESPDDVVLDVRIRWPLGVGAPTCGSYQGTPLVVSLDEPLGERRILVLEPDGSTSLILPSPFSDAG